MRHPALLESSPLTLQHLRTRTPQLWTSPSWLKRDALVFPYTVEEASLRLQRLDSLLARLFPAEPAGARIASALQPLNRLRAALHPDAGTEGRWLLKCDHSLPVAGSVKARGAFHEVMALAESLVMRLGMDAVADPAVLLSPAARQCFGQHTVAVGSTGNLGLAIGLIASALGFKAVVHMSSDAKAWKKKRLRDHGIEVVEHAGDYALAVAAGRELAQQDATVFFVDDENSRALFLGYAAAAHELAAQLAASGCTPTTDRPLFVHIPSGVGGAPGGIAYGLKQIFGDLVHCFFAEPVASPCMLVQLASGSDVPLSVYDVGLDNRTEADGLAVGQASPLVAPLMRSMLSGVFTVDDDALFRDVYLLRQHEGILVEPSAVAALRGPQWLADSPAGQAYLKARGLKQAFARATHVIWSTGGALVPAEEHARFQARGKALADAAARTAEKAG